jgi:broad specificity phosphatase PhoE
MSRAVILVRHAMPEIQQGVSSKLWGLSDSSREDCVLLAHALPAGISAIWSSDERKAKETADVFALRLGLHVQVDPAFAEVDRPQVWDRDYREVAAAYLAGAHEPGWEARDAVQCRFGSAIQAARAAAPGHILVVNHGLAMTLWVAATVALEDPVQWWRGLSFPDAWRVDMDTLTLEHLWMGGSVGS